MDDLEAALKAAVAMAALGLAALVAWALLG
jgi:hypothetical protein